MKLLRQVTVMQVKRGYSEVYTYKPTIVLTPRHIRNKKNFIDFLRLTTSNWKNGQYFFRTEEGTLAYFDLRDGKINLRRISNTGKRDLIWERFRN